MSDSFLAPQIGKQLTALVASPDVHAESFRDAQDPESTFSLDRAAAHYDILAFVKRDMERQKTDNKPKLRK